MGLGSLRSQGRRLGVWRTRFVLAMMRTHNVVPADAGTHTARLRVLARWLMPSAPTDDGGYGVPAFAGTTNGTCALASLLALMTTHTVVPADAGTHTARLRVLARWLMPSAPTDDGGYGVPAFAAA